MVKKTIDNCTFSEISKRIDYKKTKYEERKQIVDSILAEYDFDGYFSETYNPHLTMKNLLSAENEVCRILDMLTTYLLNSDEEKKHRKEKETVYKFHANEQQFKAKVKREPSTEKISEQNIIPHDLVLHFLLREDRNHKLSKTQTVTKADINRDDELGEILRDYNGLLNEIQKVLKGKDYKNKRFLLTKTSGQIKEDMVLCKDKMLGVFGYNISSSNEGGEVDFYLVDFTNEGHVEALLQVKKEFSPTSDLSHILLDFDNLINYTVDNSLTPNEASILELFREGLTKNAIARELNFTKQYIGQTVKTIIKKITVCAYECGYGVE